MRWKSTTDPKEGDVRVRRVFLWFPRCISGEWRWWEYAWIKQHYCMHATPGGCQPSWDDISCQPEPGDPWH